MTRVGISHELEFPTSGFESPTCTGPVSMAADVQLAGMVYMAKSESTQRASMYFAPCVNDKPSASPPNSVRPSVWSPFYTG